MKTSTRIFKQFMVLLSLASLLSNASEIPAQEAHHFKPTKYFFTYDAKHEPVLKLKPGDILLTTTLDAFGNKISSKDQ